VELRAKIETEQKEAADHPSNSSPRFADLNEEDFNRDPSIEHLFPSVCRICLALLTGHLRHLTAPRPLGSEAARSSSLSAPSLKSWRGRVEFNHRHRLDLDLLQMTACLPPPRPLKTWGGTRSRMIQYGCTYRSCLPTKRQTPLLVGLVNLVRPLLDNITTKNLERHLPAHLDNKAA